MNTSVSQQKQHRAFLDIINPILRKVLKKKFALDIDNLPVEEVVKSNKFSHLYYYTSDELMSVDHPIAHRTAEIIRRKENSFQILKEDDPKSRYSYIYKLYLNRRISLQNFEDALSSLNEDSIVTKLLLISKYAYDDTRYTEGKKIIKEVIREIDKYDLRLPFVHVYLGETIVKTNKTDPVKEYRDFIKKIKPSNESYNVHTRLMLLANREEDSQLIIDSLLNTTLPYFGNLITLAYYINGLKQQNWHELLGRLEFLLSHLRTVEFIDKFSIMEKLDKSVDKVRKRVGSAKKNALKELKYSSINDIDQYLTSPYLDGDTHKLVAAAVKEYPDNGDIIDDIHRSISISLPLATRLIVNYLDKKTEKIEDILHIARTKITNQYCAGIVEKAMLSSDHPDTVLSILLERKRYSELIQKIKGNVIDIDSIPRDKLVTIASFARTTDGELLVKLIDRSTDEEEERFASYIKFKILKYLFFSSQKEFLDRFNNLDQQVKIELLCSCIDDEKMLSSLVGCIKTAGGWSEILARCTVKSMQNDQHLRLYRAIRGGDNNLSDEYLSYVTILEKLHPIDEGDFSKSGIFIDERYLEIAFLKYAPHQELYGDISSKVVDYLFDKYKDYNHIKHKLTRDGFHMFICINVLFTAYDKMETRIDGDDIGWCFKSILGENRPKSTAKKNSTSSIIERFDSVDFCKILTILTENMSYVMPSSANSRVFNAYVESMLMRLKVCLNKDNFKNLSLRRESLFVAERYFNSLLSIRSNVIEPYIDYNGSVKEMTRLLRDSLYVHEDIISSPHTTDKYSAELYLDYLSLDILANDPVKYLNTHIIHIQKILSANDGDMFSASALKKAIEWVGKGISTLEIGDFTQLLAINLYQIYVENFNQIEQQILPVGNISLSNIKLSLKRLHKVLNRLDFKEHAEKTIRLIRELEKRISGQNNPVLQTHSLFDTEVRVHEAENQTLWTASSNLSDLSPAQSSRGEPSGSSKAKKGKKYKKASVRRK